MKKYIGTKNVKAEPMIKGEAFEQGLLKMGVEVTEQSKQEEGYKVEYEDGYVSWSPKEVFEKSYKLAETHLDRLQIEYNELNDKINKLNHYIQGNNFLSLNENKQSLLKQQYNVMLKYLEILKNRIN